MEAMPKAQFSKSMPAKTIARKKEETPVKIATLLMFSTSSSTLYMRIAAPPKNSTTDTRAETKVIISVEDAFLIKLESSVSGRILAGKGLLGYQKGNIGEEC